MKKCVLVCIITFVVGSLFLGWFVGFPWERIQGKVVVESYVKEKYNLTPKEINISFSIKGIDGAWVFTEEYPFGFEVYVNRKDKKVWADFFLKSFTEYLLEEQINKKLEILTDAPKVNVILQTRFSKEERDVPLEKIKENPDIILNNPEISYRCYMNNLNPKIQKVYQAFKIITENFKPTSISYNYVDDNDKEQYSKINENDYDKINTYEDFALFFSD